ncbi:hypothetical protein C8R45DRAFT_1096416 [Mycena sanguinolenta]|nr:hypothetical protein C8R45DRAFT_1096416 [Mycena sanguinolenta]
MRRNTLRGSSKENPWCFDEDGELELHDTIEAKKQLRAIAARNRALRAMQPLSAAQPRNSSATSSIGHNPGTRQVLARARHRINSGPPSSIRQDTNAEIAARRRSGGHRDPTFAALRAEVRGQAPQDLLCHVATPLAKEGRRWLRDRPLTHDDLYLDAERPAGNVEPKDYHLCAICKAMLLHPVSTHCGHTFCFVCIRMWLEKEWTCPECVTTLVSVPCRHWGTGQALASEYPTRVDNSRVKMSWIGLDFPQE